MVKERKQIEKPKRGSKKPQKLAGTLTIGMDLGDKTSRYCVLDGDGNAVIECAVPTTKKGMMTAFGDAPRCLVAMEVGTHSGWVSRLLKGLGFTVVVANPRHLRAITHSSSKDDRLDAQMLARLARVDPQLLHPVRHRSEDAQLDLMKIRSRDGLVAARTKLVNGIRGLAKSVGERVPACDADNMGPEKLEGMPEPVKKTLTPLAGAAQNLTKTIREYDKEIEKIARDKYPETARLMQVSGVGTLIAMSFVLTVEDPRRFEKSRDVGCYVGLRPKRQDSGERQPELSITKEGDAHLRRMLVQGAHYILSHRGPDSDLKRFGLKLAGQGKKNAKKRAVVAVARKLAVLLHRLWVTGEKYEPLRNANREAARQAARAA